MYKPFRRLLTVVALCLCCASFVSVPTAVAADGPLPDRWVYIERSLSEDKHVQEIEDLVTRSAKHGLNGMLFASQLDSLDLQNPEFFARLAQVKATCEKNKIEIIPLVFSAGYGFAVMRHDRNLAEGFLVQDLPLTVSKGEAIFTQDPGLTLPNGGLEEFKKDEARGWTFQDMPGEVSFKDEKVFHSGAASLRFEHFEKDKRGRARLFQEIAVKPHRCYVLSFWVKTDKLQPAGEFEVKVNADTGRSLVYDDSRITETADWKEYRFIFNSFDARKITLHMGGAGFKSGSFWIDDCMIAETGLLNILHRPGAPFTVVGEKNGTTYVEGKDYAPVIDKDLSFKADHDGLTIKLLPGSAIQEGEALKVSYYHGLRLRKGQVSICMSEPKVYEIWATQARLMQEKLGAKTFMLDMDEIRECGTCKSCADRKIAQSELLGDCITKQVEILRKASPGCRVFCWSDMLDPNHNCHKDYFMTAGDYTGAWKFVPKDLGIGCWLYDKANESLKHFSEGGHPTLAMAYYDADDTGNSAGWNDLLKKTKGGCGICYTTWENKYKVLEAFGDLVSK
ncbi:MAG TPA: carbohydrate binding domain-containing protein [Planctomycetota bacterium]|nr:carbohydrate binding domain-containing protein [Planctomycetota bacterium]